MNMKWFGFFRSTRAVRQRLRRRQAAMTAPEALEQRLALASGYWDYDYDVYAMMLINKMRADPAAFGKDLRGLFNDTKYVSAHGMKGSDPIWQDLRTAIRQSEGKVTPAGLAWQSGFDGRGGTTFVSVISSLPRTGPLVLSYSDDRAADNHNAWMKANGYAHTTQHPASSVDGIGYNPTATPDTWGGTDEPWEGPFTSRAENISYSYTVGLYPQTEAAWRKGSLSREEYLQRLVYADTLGFMLEMNNGSPTHPWGHLLNLASYSPDLKAAAQQTNAGNKTLGVANGLGVSFMGTNTSLFLTTHRLSYAPDSSYVAVVTYYDANSNQFYDVGEGLSTSGNSSKFATFPTDESFVSYSWGGQEWSTAPYAAGRTSKGPGLLVESIKKGYGVDLTGLRVILNDSSKVVPKKHVVYSPRNVIFEHRFTGGGLGLVESPVELVTTTSDPPGVPTAIAGTPANGQVNLNWIVPINTGGSPITEYRVRASGDGGATWTAGLATGSAATGFSFPGLANGTPYLFKVRAVNAAGLGDWSLASAPVTPRSVPGVPTAIAGPPANGQVNLNWIAPINTGGSPITEYRVRASGDGGATWTAGLATGSAATGFSFPGLANGTPYLFKVRAVNAAGLGDWSASSAPITPRTVPGVPSNVRAVSGPGRASLSWSGPATDGGSPILDYRIEYSVDGGKTAAVYSDSVSTATSATANKLTRGKSYVFRLSALNAAGAGVPSAWSNVVVIR